MHTLGSYLRFMPEAPGSEFFDSDSGFTTFACLVHLRAKGVESEKVIPRLQSFGSETDSKTSQVCILIQIPALKGDSSRDSRCLSSGAREPGVSGSCSVYECT